MREIQTGIATGTENGRDLEREIVTGNVNETGSAIEIETAR